MSTRDHLVTMANQIARNFAIRGEAAAAEATAEHVRLFWAPQMIVDVSPDDAGLVPIARAAFRLVRADAG
jgi:formate dehydrogenase subunit delta